jgi:hypothetical protein
VSDEKHYELKFLPQLHILWTKRPERNCKNQNKPVFDYLPTELLLKLSHKPNMDLAEAFSQPVGNMNDNSLPIPRNINLTVIKRQ